MIELRELLPLGTNKIYITNYYIYYESKNISKKNLHEVQNNKKKMSCKSYLWN